MDLISISDIQEYIHQSIDTIGGYWPPLSAIARMLEEIGELSYELKNWESDHDNIKYELADIFILSVCISNQYSAHLATEYEKLSIEIKPSKVSKSTFTKQKIKKAQDILLDINMGAGMIARIINAYEGSKTPKRGEGLLTVSESSAIFQRSLIEFANLFSIDILKVSKGVFDRKSGRDKQRFDRLYDPTLAFSLKNFQNLQNHTSCVYAAAAKLWGASKYNELNSFEDNMFIILPQLIRFTKVAPAEHLDGFIIELPTPFFGDTLDNLARTVKRFLTYLNKFDPKESTCLSGGFEQKKWQFSFNGIDLFVIAFAPFYPETNARNSKADKMFLFVQPQIMFKKKIARNKIGEVKELIRTAFDKSNQSYRSDIMNADLESYKFVKPLFVSDPPVKWWEA